MQPTVLLEWSQPRQCRVSNIKHTVPVVRRWWVGTLMLTNTQFLRVARRYDVWLFEYKYFCRRSTPGAPLRASFRAVLVDSSI